MLHIRVNKSFREWLLLIVFYLLVFQSPLEMSVPILTYIDEGFALLGLFFVIWQALKTGKLAMKKTDAGIVVLMLIFVAVGLLGNALFRYQPMEAVLIDLYTNLKFFLAIISGYAVFTICETERTGQMLLGHAKMLCLMFFVLTCVNYVIPIFPTAGIRYGLPSIKLFYYHPTYLAGAVIMLLAVQLLFFEKKSIPFMAMGLFVVCATLRGKAIAGALTYVVIAYFVIWYRKKLRVWHMVALCLAAITVAWEQIYFYFIELSGESARSVLTSTAIEIMRDYFPIGTGFGTYASASAMEHYSPVYYMYGINQIWGLSEDFRAFGSDSFWPIIIGQTGFIGTLCFAGVLVLLFLRLSRVRATNRNAYAMGLFAFAYIMICSTAEPAFHNSVAIGLSFTISYCFAQKGNEMQPHQKEGTGSKQHTM